MEGMKDDVKRASFHTTIDAATLRRAKVKCAQDGCKLGEVIEQLLAQWLAGTATPGPPQRPPDVG